MPVILRSTISATFLERARTTPNTIGPIYRPPGEAKGWTKVTYKEFYEDVKKVSYGLMALGVEHGDRVALLSNSRYEWSLSDMAILGARGVTVPVYASNMPEDIGFILKDSGAKILFAENAVQVEKLLKLKTALGGNLGTVGKVIAFESSALKGAAGHEEFISLNTLRELAREEMGRAPTRFEKNLAEASPEDLITICYTSGTTGEPKGAMLTQDNMMSVLEDAASVLGDHVRPERDAVLSFLPFSHVIGKVESMAVYVFGLQQYFAESIDRLLPNLGEARPTLMFSVPRIFEKAYARVQERIESSPPSKKALFEKAMATAEEYYSLRDQGKKPPVGLALRHAFFDRLVFSKIRERLGGRLRFALCGGAPLSAEIARFFRNAGILILEAYGLTETCAPVSMNSPDAFRIGTAGKPMPDVALMTADDGEILVKSRKVFKGYYNRPAETEEVLSKDGWFRTGDIGYLDNEGFLHITDRKKDIIITSGGKNVAPQKIENLAKTLKYISQFVVHGDRRNYLTALVTLEKDEIIQYAADNHILFSGYVELVRNPKIQALVQRAVDQLNAGLASFETIKKFVILPEEFTVESGDLTPSMKVRRNVVNKKFARELDSMYPDKKSQDQAPQPG